MKNGQVEESRCSRDSIVQCPECSSYSASVVDISPPCVRCRCADCGTIYNCQVREVTDDADNDLADEDDEDEDFAPRTKADSRAQTQPAPAPKLGFNTVLLDQAIAAGPSGIRKAQHAALKFARKYHEEAIEHFGKVTAFLQRWIDKGDSHYRARARFALVWRPRFLAALSMTNSVTLAARRARISRQAIYEHRKADAEFAKQWDEAVEHAMDMLHARVFQRSIEGDLEPVYYMGVPVGYIRKFSDKLQIEMLRAYRPDRFKTPGQAPINIDTGNKILVLDEATRMRLIEKRRQALALMPGPDEERESAHCARVEDQPMAERIGAAAVVYGVRKTLPV